MRTHVNKHAHSQYLFVLFVIFWWQAFMTAHESADWFFSCRSNCTRQSIDPSAQLASHWLRMFSSLSGPIKNEKKMSGDSPRFFFFFFFLFRKAVEYWKQLSTPPAFKSRRQDDWISIRCTSLSPNSLVYLLRSALTRWYPCAFPPSLMDAMESVKREREREREGRNGCWYLMWLWMQVLNRAPNKNVKYWHMLRPAVTQWHDGTRGTNLCPHLPPSAMLSCFLLYPSHHLFASSKWAPI